MWTFKNFPGEKPPDPPHKRGPRLTRPGARGEGAASNAAGGKGEGKEGGGRGKGKGRENVSTPQYKFLVAPLALINKPEDRFARSRSSTSS